MKYAFLLMLGLSLAGCASAELSDEELAGIHRVAVISAVGNELTLHEVPLMGFGVEDDFGPIEKFDLDRYFTEKITATLKSRYTVVPVKTPIKIEHGDKTAQWYHNDNYTKIQLPPDGDVGNGKVDTFILIEQGTGDPFAAREQVHGAFISHHPSMAPVETIVGIAYDIVVIDAKTGETLKRVAVPVAKDADDALWAEKHSALTAAQKEGINAKLREVVDDTGAKVLEIMKLVGESEGS
jgi:hypothetical protein